MTIFRFTIPIPNYEQNGIFQQHIYFERDYNFCPTHNDVVTALRKAHAKQVKQSEEHPEWGPWTFPYKACLIAIENEMGDNKLPYLTEEMKQTNKFCLTQFGRKPITAYRVELLG